VEVDVPDADRRVDAVVVVHGGSVPGRDPPVIGEFIYLTRE
jgi:hypothetical protein